MTLNYRPLPRGANGLETKLADELGKKIAMLRELLDSPSLEEQERDEYERMLFSTAQQLRGLRNSIYDRLTGPVE